MNQSYITTSATLAEAIVRKTTGDVPENEATLSVFVKQRVDTVAYYLGYDKYDLTEPQCQKIAHVYHEQFLTAD